MVQFAYTILYVKDVPQAVAFYHKAFGLQESVRVAGAVCA
ncbi:VOC family protein [Leptolyngbya sp. 7M]